jgi:hypothetical protein
MDCPQSGRLGSHRRLGEARAGGGYVDLRLLHKLKRKAVLTELKSSEKEGDLERDANRALEQIVMKNYRNAEGLRNIWTLREYGIAGFHVSILKISGVEKDDPVMSVSNKFC